VRCFLKPIELARTITTIIEEKKGENIVLLDIQKISDFTDYFVICSGTSERMIEGLANDVIKQLRKEEEVNGSVEGEPHDGWILVDYGSVILHIFSPNQRQFYSLEQLWGEGKILLHLQ
jgi:ribosome-associated protein